MNVAKNASLGKSAGRSAARFGLLAAVCLSLSGAAAGCLSRPVVSEDPSTKVNFTTSVAQKAVDKIDLLLAIDNSASMADKQNFLADAVPDLVTRLVTPNCVDSTTGAATGATADLTKPDGSQCATGSEPEFKPISDIHIALVSSSLGTFGDASICPDSPPNNDHGHLINRDGMGGVVADADPAGFLAWFPPVVANQSKTAPAKPVTDAATLIKDFQGVVVGDGQNGCGLEAQLESWYHFLVQPDPWATIAINGGVATYSGIDDVVLAQRAAFLRPDSLLAVILLSDEDDSFSDPLSVGGAGWAFSVSTFPNSTVQRTGGGGYTAPLPTTACANNPADPACTTCGFARTCNASDPSCQAIKADPNCKPPSTGYYPGDSDSLNVRFFHMKQRYGVDPQYPIERYVAGLSSKTIPFGGAVPFECPDPANKDGSCVYAEEHNGAGVYQVGAGSCTNPIFASALPASSAAAKTASWVAAKDPSSGAAYSDNQKLAQGLCRLPQGARDPKLVFFADIGGVPNELLHFDPTSPDASKISSDDWVKILGNDPEKFDYGGISPYMIQSITPRAGLPGPSTTSGDNGTDPIIGRDWNTNKNDLQFACTFPLPSKDYKTCAMTGAASCSDCNGNQNPPLCDPGGNPLLQVRAKAYPTIRELQVAHALGDQGIISSLCPLTQTSAGNGQPSPSQPPLGKVLQDPTLSGGAPNPFYGYRPAVKTIVDRLKDALTEQCLPQQLTLDKSNDAPCLILATLPNAGTQADCSKYKGLTAPSADILQKFQQGEIAAAGGDAGALLKYPVCVVPEIPVAPGDTCKTDADIGWCYVQNNADAGKTPAGRCPQAIIFTSGTDSQVKGASYSLQCIQQFGAGAAAGAATGDGG